MVAEGLGRWPTPKARAKGALEKFGLFGRHWARALPTVRRFALASFQGRVIRELDGDRVRVLFFDSEATYDRSQLTDAGVSVNPVRAHKRRPRLAAFAAALPPVRESVPLPEAPTTRLRK